MILHTPLHGYSIREPLYIIGTLVVLEIAIWLVIIVGTERPKSFLTSPVFARLKHAFNFAANSRSAAIIGIFLLMLVARLVVLPIFHVPAPRITDEFSQVLSADTFAHGRVTNPTHPMWFYFETFMENQRPTYHSMYPPGTGLFLALGQLLTGQPWFGMLFSVAAAAAAMCWMLQGWMPPRWALWGALLFVLLAAKNQLAETYLGEGVAILGGALVLGAVPRILKRPNYLASACLGVGIALLATTRPYEGSIVVGAIGLGAIFWAFRRGIEVGVLLKRVALPVALILVPVFAAIGYLNFRATGHPLLPPYQLNLVQQHITRPLIWQKPANPPPAYDHAEMAAFYQQWEVTWWSAIRQFPIGLALFVVNKAQVLYSALVWPVGLLVVIGSVQLFKDPRRRFIPLTFVAFILGQQLVMYQLLPWYLGPAWSVMILLAVYGLRYLALWGRGADQGLRFLGSTGHRFGRGRQISQSAAVLIPSALLLWVIIASIASGYGALHPFPETYSAARQQLLDGFNTVPGKHLVIVRYSESHIPFEEWVENRADIDAAKVVWARNVPVRSDADLLDYFRDRTVWVLEPDGENPKLTFQCTSSAAPPVAQIGDIRVFCGDLRKILGGSDARVETQQKIPAMEPNTWIATQR
jgi:hypothetical protein